MEKKSINEILARFIFKFKLFFIIIFSVIVLSILMYFIIFFVNSNFSQKSVVVAEEIIDEYKKYGESKNEEKLLEAIELGKKERKGSEAYIRAYWIEGLLNLDKNDKDRALESFLILAKLNKKNYLTPIALHKIAVIQEEKGFTDEALSYYLKISNGNYGYFDIERVNFNIARIYEQKNDYSAAINFYNKIIKKYIDKKEENYSEWYKLAKDRVIFYEVKNSN